MTVLLATYFNPVVVSVTPDNGFDIGGTSITITGTHFGTSATVTIGGNPCTSVVRVSLTSITCVTPSGTVGAQDIVVTNNYPTPLTSGTSGNGLFTYNLSAPTVTSIDLDLGDTAGGELRTLTGTLFTGATAVTVGGTAVTDFTVISATEIIMVMPAHAAGASQSILVTTPGGTNAANTLYEFWSPAELSLTGYWDRGNYQDTTAGTWPGLASAGSSGGRDLIQGTAANQPTEVGLEPDFDGDADYLGNATTMATMVSAGAGTVVALFHIDAAVAPNASYEDPAIFSDNASYMAMYFNTSGINAFVLDAGRTVVTKAASAGSLHLAMMRWDGVNLGLTVDSDAEVAAACGNLSVLTGEVRVGANYYVATTIDGRIRTLLTLASKLSDANYTKVLKWAKACRGLES